LYTYSLSLGGSTDAVARHARFAHNTCAIFVSKDFKANVRRTYRTYDVRSFCSQSVSWLHWRADSLWESTRLWCRYRATQFCGLYASRM